MRFIIPLFPGLFLFVLFLELSGCSAQEFKDDSRKTKFPEGRMLYRAKCQGCHDLHERQEYSANQWGPILKKMQKKAKLTDDQKNLLFLYLTEKDSLVSSK